MGLPIGISITKNFSLSVVVLSPFLSHAMRRFPSLPTPPPFSHKLPFSHVLSVRTIIYFWRYRIFFVVAQKDKETRTDTCVCQFTSGRRGWCDQVVVAPLPPSFPLSLFPSTQFDKCVFYSSLLPLVFTKWSSDHIAIELFFFTNRSEQRR